MCPLGSVLCVASLGKRLFPVTCWALKLPLPKGRDPFSGSAGVDRDGKGGGGGESGLEYLTFTVCPRRGH